MCIILLLNKINHIRRYIGYSIHTASSGRKWRNCDHVTLREINIAHLHVLSSEQRAIDVRIGNSTVNHLHTETLHYCIFANINVITI